MMFARRLAVEKRRENQGRQVCRDSKKIGFTKGATYLTSLLLGTRNTSKRTVDVGPCSNYTRARVATPDRPPSARRDSARGRSQPLLKRAGLASRADLASLALAIVRLRLRPQRGSRPRARPRQSAGEARRMRPGPGPQLRRRGVCACTPISDLSAPA